MELVDEDLLGPIDANTLLLQLLDMELWNLIVDHVDNNCLVAPRYDIPVKSWGLLSNNHFCVQCGDRVGQGMGTTFEDTGVLCEEIEIFRPSMP